MLYFNRKKVILLISHYGCHVLDLYNIMLYHSRINGFFNNNPERTVDYNNPTCSFLKKKDHTWQGKDKIYLDTIFFNYKIGCKSLFKNEDVEFLFYLGNGIETLDKINKQTGYNADVAKRYYSFRLRRICEIMCQVQNPNVYIEGYSDSKKLCSYINQKYKLFPSLDFILKYEKETHGIPENCFERYFSFMIRMKEMKKINIF